MRIIFSLDFTRPSYDWHGPHIRNLKWLHGLLSPSIQAAGGMAVSLERQLLATDYATFQNRIFADSPAGEARLHKWAALYDGEVDIGDALPGETGDVVLGFEMSPAILRALKNRGQAYIDIRVHPVRFLKDLVLSAHFSNAAMQERAQRFRTAWDGIYPSRAMITGHFRRHSPLCLADRNIFIAQTRYDATVVVDGRFAGVDDILPGLTAHNERPWLILAHPHDPDNPLNAQLAEGIGAEIVRDANFYAYLSCVEHDVSFYTFTSGGGREAEEFGHDVHFLGANHYGRSSRHEQDYIALSPAVFTPAFWQHVLQNEKVDMPPLSDLPVVRASLGESWAYPFFK